MIETSHITSDVDAKMAHATIRVNVGGITIALDSTDPLLSLQVVGPMREFVVEDVCVPDIRIRTAWGETDDVSEGCKLFDSGSVWQLYALPDGRYEFRFAAPFSAWRPYKIARFNADWTSGEIICGPQYFVPGQPVYPLEYPLDEVLLTNLLARGRGLEIHACGLSDTEGIGYLFAGQSGAGKSTTARLWEHLPGVRVLSDERVILRRVGQQIFMHGTPWHGDAGLAQPDCAPLDRIFFLGRGPTNELVPVGKALAAARLFSCSFPPFYSPECLGFTLEFLDEVTQRVPCDELRFVPDTRVVEFIREQRATLAQER